MIEQCDSEPRDRDPTASRWAMVYPTPTAQNNSGFVTPGDPLSVSSY